MLKKIPVNQLRLGMHLHAVEGSWIDHPFWKTRFVIACPSELARLHACGVAECWIDAALGLDLEPAPAPAPASASCPAPPPCSVLAAAPAPAPAHALRSLDEELQQAALICQRSRSAVMSMFSEARMGRSIDTAGCLPLVEEITCSVQRNPGALVSLARLKTQDDYSYMHSVAVCALMVVLARQLGMDEAGCRAAGLAGLMHDVGKALMPLAVLNKPGPLTEAEFRIIRGHPESGHALLLEGRGATPEMLDVVLHHHEKMDGSGYPHGLAGAGLSRLARMAAICDVYDAVTSNRPYKNGWDPAQSITRMATWQGQFDATLFAAFVRSLGIYPAGSLVRLESGRLAVVVEQNPAALAAPVVKIFFSGKSQMRIPPTLLDLSHKGCKDRIVGRDTGAEGRFGNLDDLWLDPELLRRARR